MPRQVCQTLANSHQNVQHTLLIFPGKHIELPEAIEARSRYPGTRPAFSARTTPQAAPMSTRPDRRLAPSARIPPLTPTTHCSLWASEAGPLLPAALASSPPSKAKGRPFPAKERGREVEGIGPRRAERIIAAWAEQAQLAPVHKIAN
jgi:hypothetical protein